MLMKVERSPGLLVIDHRPVFVAAVLSIMLLAFVGAGLTMLFDGVIGQALLFLFGAPLFIGIFFALFVRRNQLILNRQTGEVLHRRRTLYSHTEQRFDLSMFEGAEVERNPSSDGKPTFRMAYVLSDGPDAGTHPFTMPYSNGNGAQRAADAVNEWLAEGRGEAGRAS